MTSGRRSSVTPSSPPTPVVHSVFGSSVAVADLFDLQPSICAIVSMRMLWTGESPKAESLTETMESYFNALHGFLLCFHGSTLDAGPTLSSIIHGSVKQIIKRESSQCTHSSILQVTPHNRLTKRR
ncbi:hypothetical protein ISN44_As09g029190 [Arabidopsis suecica]|uniref:Cyclin-D1-binding protein 1-like N-terminal domain-containing protein n=1 Tax=Arabidopsis suecica TaxID=45249 RepID=A0A8T2AKJ2_ARASU|nr:hypothetical protein ISN44_As09g029190 [Arabidopsis suecica]